MKIAVIALVLESILPTIRPGFLRDDKSNGEGLIPVFRGQNSKFSDGDTLMGVLINFKTPLVFDDF